MTLTHCMLDLETLSTRHNARILAIGAVLFDEEGVFEKFYTPVKVPNPDRLGKMKTPFDVSTATMEWWSEQSEEAQAVFWDPDAVDIEVALEMFSDWLTTNTDPAQVRVWGNGADFDNPTLATAYDIMGFKAPWRFYNNRCYRTVKNLFPNVKMKRTGTYHNALDDAESQANHLLHMGVKIR
jgi:hypothetical protein